MSDINDKLVKMRDGLIAISSAVQAIADQPAPGATWRNVQGTPTTIQGYGITNAFDGDYENLYNRPTLFSGSYNDLTDQPAPLKAHINDRELSGNKIHGGATQWSDGGAKRGGELLAGPTSEMVWCVLGSEPRKLGPY